MSGVTRALRVVLAFVISLVLLPASAQAGILFHNGLVGSVPPGSGEKNVYFEAATDVIGQAFLALDSHTLVYEYEEQATSVAVQDIVGNMSGIDWSVYYVQLLGSDFYEAGAGTPCPEVNPVVLGGAPGDGLIHLVPVFGTATVISSGISRDGENALLVIVFDDLPASGEAFSLAYECRDVGDPGVPGAGAGIVIMNSQPVPEPATLVLVGVGLLGVLIRRSLGRD